MSANDSKRTLAPILFGLNHFLFRPNHFENLFAGVLTGATIEQSLWRRPMPEYLYPEARQAAPAQADVAHGGDAAARALGRVRRQRGALAAGG